jgi:transcriptional regulator with XRE-family HTH domain
VATSVSFPELLRKHLEKSGVTQRSFAEKTGISGGYPAHFLSGERPPPLDHLTDQWRTGAERLPQATKAEQASALQACLHKVTVFADYLQLELYRPERPVSLNGSLNCTKKLPSMHGVRTISIRAARLPAAMPPTSQAGSARARL